MTLSVTLWAISFNNYSSYSCIAELWLQRGIFCLNAASQLNVAERGLDSQKNGKICGKWRRRSRVVEWGVGGRRTISCTGSIDVRLSTAIPTESVALRRLSTKRRCSNHWLLSLLFPSSSSSLTNFYLMLFVFSCSSTLFPFLVGLALYFLRPSLPPLFLPISRDRLIQGRRHLRSLFTFTAHFTGQCLANKSVTLLIIWWFATNKFFH